MAEIGILVGGIIVVLMIIVFFLYNSIIKAKNSVENNKSTIQTILQNRYDLIPNLVEVVKQYVNHEQKMIEQVTMMRAQLVHQDSFTKQSAQEDATLAGSLKHVFALSENYPDLKANTTFIRLQDQWSELEDRLQAARRGYNYAVTVLRNKQETFPSNIIANIMTVQSYELFEAQKDAQTSLSAKDLFKNS